MKELILYRGLPGTGKSERAEREYPNFIHLDIESFFMHDDEYKFVAYKIKDAHAWCLSLVRYYLNQEESVTVSSFFCKQWEIMGYIGAGLKYEANITIHVCSVFYKNVHNVPSHIIEQLSDSWEDYSLSEVFEKYKKKQEYIAKKNNTKHNYGKQYSSS